MGDLDDPRHGELELLRACDALNRATDDLMERATRERWPLAGDQLYVDLDLSEENVPAGTRIAVGAAVIEVTDQPHRGCRKFVERYGLDAMKFVNSAVGETLHLRGVSAKVVRPGTVRVGDPVIRRYAGGGSPAVA